MPRDTTRIERLRQVEALLLAHPRGMTQSELARHLGVHRSTVLRMLPDLTTHSRVYETEGGRLAIDRDSFETNLPVTVHEAMAIYLAARLLHRQSDEQNPHAISALVKLGKALERIAPAMAEGIIETADGMRADRGRDAPGYLAVLESLTRAWMAGRWARIRYRSRGSAVETESLFAPYMLEACGPGFATYVLGRRRPPDALRVLKVERITRAELTDDEFEPPRALDVARAFARAWGVWLPAEGESVDVVLRFAAHIAERVRETRWHPGETTALLADGSLEWRARIGDATEIVPWVLGWGAAVEVLAPDDLRAMVAAEYRRAAAAYESAYG